MTEIKLPMLGLTMSEGSIRQWLKSEGDAVSKGEPLFEMESDKALLEVEAPEDGILVKILTAPDQTVDVGSVVGLLGAANEAAAPKTISPRARRLAEEHGLNWREIPAGGADGQITEADVKARLGASAPAVQLLSATRRTVIERLRRSRDECVPIYLTVAIDVTAIRRSGLSYNDVILKALGCCLQEFPAVNASLRDGGLELHHAAHIGFAVAVDDDTLVVPVVRNAERLSLSEIAVERRRLVERARARRLTPEEMSGGTFTLSNLGMYGVEQFTAIINPPETGVLAVGAVTEEPRAVDGQIVIRSVLRATLAADHRVVDGALAGKFLARLRTRIEEAG